MRTDLDQDQDFSKQIADAIRDAIVEGQLLVDARLPSESELSDKFGVSRPTVREALKRLAAQNLIRTQRGATGGAFVNRISFDEAHDQQITTATLLMSMNDIDFETACEARFTLERAAAPMAAQRRENAHLTIMQTEIDRQGEPALSGPGFCASDVAFHTAMIAAAGNPVLSYHLSGAVAAMQPLMNMITFSRVDRARVVALHERLLEALRVRDADAIDRTLGDQAAYMLALAGDVRAARAAREAI